MSFLLRPQFILLAGAIATPTYIAYEVHRLTKLYPRRKPEHFSPVLIPPHPCTQHVPRSNAVVFSARLHGDVLYAARRRYIRDHADVFWTEEEFDGSSDGGFSQTNNADGNWTGKARRGGKRNNGVRSAFDDMEDAVSLNELWARTFMSCKTISREAWWYGKLFNRQLKNDSSTSPNTTSEASGTTTKSFIAEGSINVSFSPTTSPPLQMSSSASSTISTPSFETPNLSNPTVRFAPNKPILSGLFTVLRPPTDSHGMLMRWDVPRSGLCRWGRLERFMGMWMPWRPMSGGKQMLDAVAVWEDGSVWVDVRYSCAQFYEDDMSDDPLEDGEDRRQRDSHKKEEKEHERRRGLFDRVRIRGISSIDKRKETPRWMMWFHEMYARKLLDEAVRKLVKDGKADLGDGTRKRAMRVVEGEGMETRIIEEEGSVMRGKENGFGGDGKG